MKRQDLAGDGDAVAVMDGEALLSELVASPAAGTVGVHRAGVAIGELVAMTDEGRTPLVIVPGQAVSAVRARSVVDLHGGHIGRHVVLAFEDADPRKPVVMGVLREGAGLPLEARAGSVAVDVDGERMLVTAKDQLVLRCGKASITLTKAGKVLISGAYVSSRSSGVNRVKGGSVQLN